MAFRRQFRLAIAKDAQREGLHQGFANPLARDDGIHLQDGRARRKNLDQREAAAVLLNLQRLLHRLLRLHDVLHVVQRDTLDVSRRFERSQQLGNMQRQTLVAGPASPGRRCAHLTHQRRGRHLPAGHAVNGVVDEEHADVLAAIGGMDDLRRADGREVAIALVRHDNGLGMRALERSRRRGSASVRHLHIAHVEVVVGEDRAAHGTHQDGAVLQAKFSERFGDQLVRDAVSAARAIVGLLLQFAFALEPVVERRRLFMNDFVPVHNASLLPTLSPESGTRVGHPIYTRADMRAKTCAVISSAMGTLPPARP